MRNRPPRNSPSQVLLGVIVIALGFLFLLDNLGWVDVRYTLHFWPIILIGFGIVKIMQSRSGSGYVAGGALILVGALLTLKRMGLIYLSGKALWPLLLIGLGLFVVFRSVRTRPPRAATPIHPLNPLDPLVPLDPVAPLKPVNLDKLEPPDQSGWDEGDAVIDITAVLGGYERRVVTQDFRGGQVTAIMGGCALDLRQSSIRSEAVLNVFAMCGGITIKVPPDWSVILRGTPILGGFEEKTSVPPDGSKRLIVQGCTIMGGLEVRN